MDRVRRNRTMCWVDSHPSPASSAVLGRCQFPSHRVSPWTYRLMCHQVSLQIITMLLPIGLCSPLFVFSRMLLPTGLCCHVLVFSRILCNLYVSLHMMWSHYCGDYVRLCSISLFHRMLYYWFPSHYFVVLFCLAGCCCVGFSHNKNLSICLSYRMLCFVSSSTYIV